MAPDCNLAGQPGQVYSPDQRLAHPSGRHAEEGEGRPLRLEPHMPLAGATKGEYLNRVLHKPP